MQILKKSESESEPYSVCAVYFNLNMTDVLKFLPNIQSTCFLQVTGRLEEFRDLVKEVVRSACRAALTEAGFIPDDYLVDVESAMDGTFLRKQPLL